MAAAGSETQPLLASDEAPGSNHDQSSTIESRRPKTKLRKSPLWPMLRLLLLLALQYTAIRIMNLPLNRVIELSYCRRYYQTHDPSVIQPDGDVDERLCKLDGIQEQLAWLHGMVETVHVVCDLAVTIPFGVIADVYNRKLVLCLNLGALALMYGWLLVVGLFDPALPIESMLSGPILSLLGGGECVFMSILLATLTDIASTAEQRTEYLAYFNSISYVVTICGPALAAAAMTLNLWLPFFIGIGFLLLGIPLAASLPSTHVSVAPKSVDPTPYNTADAPLLQSEAPEVDHGRNLEDEKTGIMRRTLHELKHMFDLLSGRQNFQLLLWVFLLSSIASSGSMKFIQYISKRYGWKFAEAGFLVSAKAATNITLLTVIVPVSVKLLLRNPERSAAAVNITAAEISLVISIIGVVLVASSTTIWMLVIAFLIYALGSALPVFTMSLVKDKDLMRLEDNANARAYGLVMLAKTFGQLVGTPLTTIVWAKGIAIGGMALGLPYYFSAPFYAAAWVIVRRFRS